LDGLRCVFKNGKLWTRNGKEIVGFNHIIEELKTLGEFNLVDGELYSHSLDFQTIQGYVLSHKNINEEEKKQIFYNVFVILMDGTTTESMINHMKRLNDFNGKKLKYIKFLEYEVINNDFEKIKELDRKWVSMGYEGLMLRSWDVVYAYKRSDDLLKFKSFFEESLTVVGALEGKGKYQGMLGKFICEGVVEGYNVKTEVGSGFNDKQREEFWKKKKSLIGKLISVKYQGVTTTDGENSLRFPIFRGFQLDRN
jgi:DNA ligase-1